jgi:hypothetical protein
MWVIPDERNAMLGKKIIQFGNDLFSVFPSVVRVDLTFLSP